MEGLHDELSWGAVTVAVLFLATWMLHAILRLGQAYGSRSEQGGYAKVSSSDCEDDLELAELDEEKKEVKAVVPVPKPTSKHVTAMDINSTASVKDCLTDISWLGLIMLYSWWCENRPAYPHGGKSHDADVFWFCLLIFIVYGLIDIRKNKCTDVLNRYQTEEWKGWMQYIFLAYHYFHYSEVYNSVRVFISCYVWLTGFGNFSFFYMKDDFSFLRFWNMQWRLNFLVFFLCLAHNNTYILYYICPLHTFYFCMVYVIMRIGRSYNHGKWFVRIKMLLSAGLIYAIWEIPGVYDYAFFWLGESSMVGAKSGTRHEFHFRTALDHWSTFFGMLFALNFPVYASWITKVEVLSWKKQAVYKSAVGVVFLAGSAWWFQNIFFLPKIQYNEVHPYFFIIPVLAYIFMRNCSHHLRSYHLHNWAEMGKVTLETYLMQHHIWLTGNAKTLLVWIPDMPVTNSFFTTLVFILVSRKLYRLTISLRARFIPNDQQQSLVYLASLIGGFCTCASIGAVVHTMGSSIGVIVLGAVGFAACVAVAYNGRNSQAMVNIVCIVWGVAVVLCVLYAVGGRVTPTSFKAPAAQPPKPADADGIAQSVWLGFGSLAFAMAINFFMDNFGGLTHATTAVINSVLGTSASVSWSKAYAPILKNLGKA